MKLITHSQWFVLILSLFLSVMVKGCAVSRSRSIVKNKSDVTLFNTRLLVVDENTSTIIMGNLSVDSQKMVYLPTSFGEATLNIEFTIEDQLYSSTCGYVEDSMYIVTIIVEEGVKVTCDVDLSFF